MKTRAKRVSRDQWLQKALDVLQKEGIQGVRVERLARDLGIAKAGFYWHFANRDEMLKELLDYWTHEYTEVVTNGMAALEGAPKKKLFETMKMISSQHLAKYELSMRSWAAIDPSAARAVKRVYKIRTGFLKSIFQELGFGEAEADMRSKTFASFYIWQEFMYFPCAKSEREKLMKRQLEWFCCRTK